MMEGFSKHGIVLKKSKGQTKVKCPKCSHTRKKKSEPCLSVNIDEGVWNCHNCGWSGSLNKGYTKTKIYEKPVWTNNTELSDNMVKWFKSRGITQKVLVRNKVTESTEYFPQVEEKRNAINFNYFKDGELVNVKFRDGNKNFKMFKNGEPTFYGIDDIKDHNTCIIVEGEIDKLAFEVAGYPNCISVPNGASDKKMDFLENSIEYFEDLDKIFIAVDNDEKGVVLEKELSRRLGRDRCLRVIFPDDCKDVNDVLIKHGQIEIDECISNAEPYPIEGILTVKGLESDIDRLYDNGLESGLKVGHDKFDKLFTFVTSQLTVITGVPTHGKSHFLEHLCMRLSAQHGWKFGVFSPEHFPVQLHFSSLAEKYVGKSFGDRFLTKTELYTKEKKRYLCPRMDRTELNAAKEFINDHYFWIRPDTENDTFTIDEILKSAKSLIMRYGINALIIDPYNKISHKLDGNTSETNYVNEFLTKLTIFKQKYDIHIFLVAHPRKMMKGSDGSYDIPTLYDIAGSANFYNQVDNGITVYRNMATKTTTAYIQKVKFRHIGTLGHADFKYNLQNGRYTADNESEDNEIYVRNQEFPI